MENNKEEAILYTGENQIEIDMFSNISTHEYCKKLFYTKGRSLVALVYPGEYLVKDTRGGLRSVSAHLYSPA